MVRSVRGFRCAVELSPDRLVEPIYCVGLLLWSYDMVINVLSLWDPRLAFENPITDEVKCYWRLDKRILRQADLRNQPSSWQPPVSWPAVESPLPSKCSFKKEKFCSSKLDNHMRAIGFGSLLRQECLRSHTVCVIIEKPIACMIGKSFKPRLPSSEICGAPLSNFSPCFINY